MAGAARAAGVRSPSYGVHQERKRHFEHGAKVVQNAGRMPLQQLPQAVDGICRSEQELN